MSSSKFSYITASQLLASVEGDFHKWADAGFIDHLKLIKVIRECNETLGLRIYRPRETILYVTPVPGEFSDYRRPGRADLPLDFYKAEMVFALHKRLVNSMLPIGSGFNQVFNPPSVQQVERGEITNFTGPCCLDATDNCSWLIKTPLTQLQVQITDIVPLEIFMDSDRHFTEYSPNRAYRHHQEGHHHHHSCTINVEEGYVETDFPEAVLHLSYLGDMKNEKGEDLVPFHAKVNEYYEWAVKARILQNILYNGEADVAGLYKDAQHQRNLAFQSAVNFVMGKEAQEWHRYEHERARKFYRQYYSIFY